MGGSRRSGSCPGTDFDIGTTVYDDTHSQIPPYDYWAQYAQKHYSRHTLVLRPESPFPTCFLSVIPFE